MPITKEVLDDIALSQTEYDMILDLLGREPNSVELGMFGALWSEHCGYKHSRPLLKLFPSSSNRVLSQAGAENAGAIDIGDGLAVIFKVESHNHPSAVEPFQGAATGIGGIVRDILAMGARPIALLNSLRFGPLLETPNRHLFTGVIGGISWYGNCIGVPNIAGEIYFDQSYSMNPLVNAMCVGLARKDQLTTSAAGEAGNVLLLVGADTGRDGIHGASGLASRAFDQNQEMRPTVQVGNPFMKKILIEACLDALDTGNVLGVQDLGAAGLTSAAIESAARSGRGVRLDISKVLRREENMSGYDVMLSESQERMLLIILPDKIDRVKAVFKKWDISCQEIGTVIDEPEARVFDGLREIARLSIPDLVRPPRYRLKGSPSPEQLQLQRFDLASVDLPTVAPSDLLIQMLASPNIASKQSVYQQYDHHVQTNTIIGPGGDAAVLRIKDTDKAIALCIDGNGRYCYLDPYRGGQIVVAEVCRNLTCSGALPLALTNCLNFGNPEKPEVYYQLESCIRGMAKACRALGVPVVSGNVSLYNESRGKPIYPTPVVGGLGLLEHVRQCTSAFFPEEGLKVVLLGCDTLRTRLTDLAGSEYLQLAHGIVAGRPSINLALEVRVQDLCRRAIKDGILTSAHDCSDGGLAVALSECCIPKEVGFRGHDSLSHLPRRWDAAIFGERQSRIVVSMPTNKWPRLERLATALGVPTLDLGTTGGNRFILGRHLDISLNDIKDAWVNGMEQLS